MKIKEAFEDILPLIKNFSPLIASALGNPVGTAAAAVIPILANAFDSNSGDLKSLSQKILNDPEAEEKLKTCASVHFSLLNQLMDDAKSTLIEAQLNVTLKWQPDLKTE